MDFTGDLFLDLRDALGDAFDPNSLDAMLRAYFNKRLFHISNKGDFMADVDGVIAWADQIDQEAKFLESAYTWNPTNRKLQAVASRFSLSSNTLSESQLEKIVNDARSFLDVNQWSERLGQIEEQVCRVEINGKAAGTGFLVGPDVIMTNHHVIANMPSGASVVARFDYKIVKDETGTLLQNDGTIVKAAEEWLLDSSEPSPIDTMRLEDKPGDPSPDLCDYALILLSSAVGRRPAGKNPDRKRGWVNTNPSLEPGEKLHADVNDLVFIFQHPDGLPMKLNFDTIDAYNGNRTRVRYRANTLNGSSGSPVFDRNWNLVALHHSGEPVFGKAKYNEGIPMLAIRTLLEQRGKLDLIDAA